MMDFFFFMKTFALTIVLVLFLQIQVGERSLESHAMGWVQSSILVEPLNQVARGAGRLVHDLTQKIYAGVHQNVGKKNKKEEGHHWTSSFHWFHSSSQQDSAKSDHSAEN